MGRIYKISRALALLSLLLAFPFGANAVQTHWQTEENAYQYDMQMYITLMSNGDILERWDEIELAAFMGSECRGVAIPISIGSGSIKLYSLKVRSNTAGENISFKYYDKVLNKEITLLQTVLFVSDGSYGDIRNPFVLSSKVELRPDESTHAIYVSPNGSADGSSPDRPAGDIQQALDLAKALKATSVRLIPGTYRLIKTLTLRPGINLKGESGEPVVLDGQGTFRIIEVESSDLRSSTESFTVSNLTLQNGYADGNGGAALLNDNVTVDNCLFTNNRCTGKGGAMYGGKALRSLFCGNSANQGGAVAVTELDFCTVVKNRSTNASAAAFRSVLSNSIVWSNGGGIQMDGCILRGVALEAIQGTATGDKLIYLSSDNNTNSHTGSWAPVFEAPETGHWMLGPTSPLSKLAIVNGKRCDLGYRNGTKNPRSWVYTTVSFEGYLVYKENFTPLVQGYDIWNQPASGLKALVQYRKDGETIWTTEKPVKAGKYQVKASITDADANWQSGESTELVEDMAILPRKITLTAQVASKVYGMQDPVLSYVISEPLASGVLSGTITRDPGEHSGTYSILQGTLVASSDYSMTFQRGTFTITKRPVTVSAMASGKTYGDTDTALSYNLKSNTGTALVGEDQPTGKLTREAGEQVGSYAICQGTLTLPADYELTYKPASFTISKRTVTITAQPAEKIYGEPDPVFNYHSFSVSGDALVGKDTFTGSLSREPGEKTGTYKHLQGTLALNNNYILTFIPSQLVIKKRPVTIHAVACEKQYGDPDPEFTYTLSSVYTPVLKEGDTASGKLDREPGEHIGTYNLFAGSLILPVDYEVTFSSAPFTILPLPVTVTADASRKIYGSADPEFTFTVQPSLIGKDYFSGSLQRETGEHTGRYTIQRGNLSLSENYFLTFNIGEFTIDKLSITVTPNPTTSIYGEKEADLTYNYTPALVAGDKFTGRIKRASGSSVGMYAIEQGDLSLSDNYLLHFVSGTYNITPRPVTILAVNGGKMYGQSDPELRVSVLGLGLIGRDSYYGTLLRQPGEDVKTYIIEQGSVSLSHNYRIESFIPGKFEISPAEPEIRIEGLYQTYDRLPKQVKIITIPEGLEYQLTYGEDNELPVMAGQYEVLVKINTLNYIGQKKETMHIVEPGQEMITCTKVASLSDNSLFETHYEEFRTNPNLRIYNEWGKQIYEKNDYQSGEYDFRGLPVGTYYYVLSYSIESGEQRIQKGFVELIP